MTCRQFQNADSGKIFLDVLRRTVIHRFRRINMRRDQANRNAAAIIFHENSN